jgi:hypothetical protein
MEADAKRAAGRAAVSIAALGVVFGDIGTSPIYTIQTAFDPGDPHPIQASLQSVYGVVSLIFWAVLLIVTVKYVGLVMSADNDGEGGIMALISQIRQIGPGLGGRTKFVLAGLGVFGAVGGRPLVRPAPVHRRDRHDHRSRRRLPRRRHRRRVPRAMGAGPLHEPSPPPPDRASRRPAGVVSQVPAPAVPQSPSRRRALPARNRSRASSSSPRSSRPSRACAGKIIGKLVPKRTLRRPLLVSM